MINLISSSFWSFGNITDRFILLVVCILYVYTIGMGIEWDPNKARINLQKHGVYFSDVEFVLFDTNALTREDTQSVGEQRFVTIGSD
ncbi:MAG: BrnT family toxin, partial [Spirochaetales bacterium]|nr:BrnT family toxin [Spirochaetales bacterium]